jgi:hypothetical protein
MSLHRNDYLVSSRQADLAREASEARLAKVAAEGADRKAAHHDTSIGARLHAGLSWAIRPLRRAATVEPAPTIPAVQGSHRP